MLLQAKDLWKSFGGLIAVCEVGIEVNTDEIVSIIGPNGAGKSTLFNLITGHIRLDKGEVFFKNRDITSMPPHEISSLGIGRSFQKLNIFPRLTSFQKRPSGPVLCHGPEPESLLQGKADALR